MYIRDIQRFENPSKLRTYCGTAPGMFHTRGVEANFNPELKGFMMGQIAESFIKAKSQYKRVYDEKKAYYLRLHPEAETLSYEEKKTRLEAELGRKLRNGEGKQIWTKMKIHRYALKAMMNRFIVELWAAWYKAEGKVPPVNAWILDEPHHNTEPMIVPYNGTSDR
jgi:hypothetical protein